MITHQTVSALWLAEKMVIMSAFSLLSVFRCIPTEHFYKFSVFWFAFVRSFGSLLYINAPVCANI